jgi:CP family cyanate transporter-like MFS transporter
VSYWVSNAFVPDYLRATHHGSLITLALTVLNVSQLPASLLVVLFPDQMVARRWPLVLAGLIITLVVGGLAGGGYWVVTLVGVVGFASAVVFVLCLSLPPIIAGPHEVHHVSAAMFTISYVCPFVASLIGGGLWDITGTPLIAFAPLAVAGIAMALLALGLNLPHRMPAAAEALHPTP